MKTLEAELKKKNLVEFSFKVPRVTRSCYREKEKLSTSL